MAAKPLKIDLAKAKRITPLKPSEGVADPRLVRASVLAGEVLNPETICSRCFSRPVSRGGTLCRLCAGLEVENKWQRERVSSGRPRTAI